LQAWKEQKALKQKLAAEGSSKAESSAASNSSPNGKQAQDKAAALPRAKFDPRAIKKQTDAKNKGEVATLEGDAGVPALPNGKTTTSVHARVNGRNHPTPPIFVPLMNCQDLRAKLLMRRSRVLA
jgi:hypothetical protein